MVRKKKSLPFFLWHRRIGLASSVLVIILAITGIMLNHTESMELDNKYINSTWLLSWYDIEPSTPSVTFQAETDQVSQWQHQVFLNQQAIFSSTEPLLGAVKLESFIMAAFDTELVLLTSAGEIVERIPLEEKIKSLQRIGKKDQLIVIENDSNHYYSLDENSLEWKKLEISNAVWSQMVELNETENQLLRNAYLGKGLTLERVILDLHSGRIFGQWGVYLMDLAAVFLIVLSISGGWMWLTRRHKQKNKHHYQKHHR